MQIHFEKDGVQNRIQCLLSLYRHFSNEEKFFIEQTCFTAKLIQHLIIDSLSINKMAKSIWLCKAEREKITKKDLDFNLNFYFYRDFYSKMS
jgi:hypothetical protein